jgi:hypothetical protein
MKRIQIERLCPIIQGECIKTSCAWWIKEIEECRMFGILQEKTKPKKTPKKTLLKFVSHHSVNE